MYGLGAGTHFLCRWRQQCAPLSTVIERPDIGLSRVCVLQVYNSVFIQVYNSGAVIRKLSDPTVGLSECGVSISVFMRLFCLSWLGLSWFVLSPGCRAVELSRLRRAAVEAVVEALPVEPVEFLSSPVKPRRG